MSSAPAPTAFQFSKYYQFIPLHMASQVHDDFLVNEGTPHILKCSLCTLPIAHEFRLHHRNVKFVLGVAEGGVMVVKHQDAIDYDVTHVCHDCFDKGHFTNWSCRFDCGDMVMLAFPGPFMRPDVPMFLKSFLLGNGWTTAELLPPSPVASPDYRPSSPSPVSHSPAPGVGSPMTASQRDDEGWDSDTTLLVEDDESYRAIAPSPLMVMSSVSKNGQPASPEMVPASPVHRYVPNPATFDPSDEDDSEKENKPPKRDTPIRARYKRSSERIRLNKMKRDERKRQ